MIYLRLESNFWGTEGIRDGKLNVECEHSSLVSVVPISRMWERREWEEYGDPCGPRMVARQCIMSASSSGLALPIIVVSR